MTEAQIKDASKLYVAGFSTAEIGVKFHCTSEMTRYWLKKGGTVLRVPGHRRGINNEPNADTEAIKKMRKEGSTFREIGDLFGLTPKAVQARLAYHGIR